MDLTSGFTASTLGIVTMRTPFSMAAFTPSTLAFSWSLNLLRNLPWLLSTLSLFSSISFFRSPLIYRIFPSFNSTFTSSFLSPGRSASNTWALSVSFQSNLTFKKVESLGLVREEKELGFVLKGEGKKASKGSQMSGEKGPWTLDLHPKKLGIKDIFPPVFLWKELDR
ncbi:hypothetical protein AMTR_s00023p00249070 [Amborella trichopoda]|uniref:Uncharacterized protein n=1 Tax=Amborella trichopoda TaxID=13333 RepID=W1NJY7_AMBTC|nr:hypothetical protein AMTR_s00023p00249070 [Amborella trichopoda]